MKNVLIGFCLAVVLLGAVYFTYVHNSSEDTAQLSNTEQSTTTAQQHVSGKPTITASAPKPQDKTYVPEFVPDTDFAKLTVRGDVPELGFGDQAHQYYWKTDTGIYVVRNLKREGPDLGHMVLTGGDAYRIPSADVHTFVLIEDQYEEPQFAKDKNNVYYRGRLLPTADPATFTEFCTAYAHCVRDKNHIFIIKEDGTLVAQ